MSALRRPLATFLLPLAALAGAGCGPPPSGSSCAALTGSAWVPGVAGVTAANHDDTDATTGVKLFPVERQTKTVHISGVNSAISESNQSDGVPSIVTFQFSLADDLLERGSFALVADPINASAAIQGYFADGARLYPLLISLTDPNGVEYVRLSGCSSGFYSCSGTSCNPVGACVVGAGSAFVGDTDSARFSKWAQSQGYLSDLMVSSNSFPTCDWASGTVTPAGTLQCPFTQAISGGAGTPYLSSGKLVTGTWTAKYALGSNFIATSNGNTAFSEKADIRLSIVRKRDGDHGAAGRGAIDLNVIIVGTDNINDSRTAKGKQNLDALFTHVVNHYNQSSTQLKVGRINAYEWTCEQGGDAYATLEFESTGDFFKTGSALMPSSTEAKAVNVFLTSSIVSSQGGFIVLGRSGGITGPVVNGTQGSGAVFATFGELETMNASCSGSGACAVADQDLDFIDMGGTISHEIGHFLGLNHLSEAGGTSHDRVPDTPICTATQTVGTSSLITLSSCRSASETNVHPTLGGTCNATCSGGNLSGPGCGATYSAVGGCYCPAVEQCQFNHVMWWTTKNFGPNGSGDGQLFSASSGDVLNRSVLAQ